jgi:hypothetical protein
MVIAASSPCFLSFPEITGITAPEGSVQTLAPKPLTLPRTNKHVELTWYMV